MLQNSNLAYDQVDRIENISWFEMHTAIFCCLTNNDRENNLVGDKIAFVPAWYQIFMRQCGKPQASTDL